MAIVGITATLALGASANAGILVTPVRSSFDTSWDQIDFFLTSFTDGDAVAGNKIQLLEGTFTSVGAAVISVPGTTANYKGKTGNTNLDAGLTPPISIVNLDTVNLAATWNRTGTSSTLLTGGWYTAVDAGKIIAAPSLDRSTSLDQTVNNLIAEIFVSKGGDVAYSGLIGTPLGTGTETVAFTSVVPEPGSLALVGLGATALLARKRRDSQAGLASTDVSSPRHADCHRRARKTRDLQRRSHAR